MFGLNQGTLEVVVTDASGNSTLAWSAFGDQGDQWNMAQVSLAGYTGDVTIQIVGTTGGSYDSDMAIDDICIAEAVAYGCTDSIASNYEYVVCPIHASDSFPGPWIHHRPFTL